MAVGRAAAHKSRGGDEHEPRRTTHRLKELTPLLLQPAEIARSLASAANAFAGFAASQSAAYPMLMAPPPPPPAPEPQAPPAPEVHSCDYCGYVRAGAVGGGPAAAHRGA